MAVGANFSPSRGDGCIGVISFFGKCHAPRVTEVRHFVTSAEQPAHAVFGEQQRVSPARGGSIRALCALEQLSKYGNAIVPAR